MINDPIFLRFKGDRPLVRVDLLSALIHQAREAFREAVIAGAPPPIRPGMQQPWTSEIDLQLFLCAPPRQACLEILLLPEISIPTDINIFIHLMPVPQREEIARGVDVNALKDIFFAAMWLAYKCWRLGEQYVRGKDKGAAEDLKEALTKRMLESEKLKGTFRRIRSSALRIGGIVTLERSDIEELTICDESDLSWGVGAESVRLTSASLRELFLGNQLARAGAIYKVFYEGREYDSFLTAISNQRGTNHVVVLWGSENPIPEVGKRTEVEFEPIEKLDQVRLQGERPEGYSEALGAIMVSKAQGQMR